MHRHHGDFGRNDKFFAHADFDDDWADTRSKRERAKVRRVRHRPLEKYSRTKRIDWFEDFDDD